ncbi:MAG: gamma-glutamylcyclotransferase [Desulfuromonadaceae bacterium]|nr:gamma-glutamylcyclotransferase [Desulfuromonadaceae bacterium]
MFGRFGTRRKANHLRQQDLEQTQLFFFYGSLMERYENFNRFIRKRVTSIAVGYCQGFLYYLPMGFPGLIQSENDCNTLVAGEVMTFNDPLRVMRLLDRLEDFHPLKPEKSIYLRRKLALFLENPNQPGPLKQVDAWVYTYPQHHLSIDHERQVRIECGQWKAFRQTGEAAASATAENVYRLRLCDQSQQVFIDPLVYEEEMVRRACQLHQCQRFCHNSSRCAFNAPKAAAVDAGFPPSTSPTVDPATP